MKPKIIIIAIFETYFLIVSKNGENNVNDSKVSLAKDGASSLYFSEFDLSTFQSFSAILSMLFLPFTIAKSKGP